MSHGAVRAVHRSGGRPEPAEGAGDVCHPVAQPSGAEFGVSSWETLRRGRKDLKGTVGATSIVQQRRSVRAGKVGAVGTTCGQSEGRRAGGNVLVYV